METVNSFDILIALIKACQSNDEYPHVDGPNGYEAAMGSPKYLLGQSIRQLWNRKGHRCVSKTALDLWNNLKVGDSIFNYWYQKPIYYKNEEPVHIKNMSEQAVPHTGKEILNSPKKGTVLDLGKFFILSILFQ